MFTQAIARKPAKNFAQGLTTTVSAKPPRYELLLQQHETYLEALKSCGLEVTLLDPLPEYPDAYFVEDTAVVLSLIHISEPTRPAPLSRMPSSA